MSVRDRQAHWDNVYSTKSESEVSWFQETPVPSLELLALIDAQPDSAIVDIGGGASRLVDRLVSEGYEEVTVLDLSEAALAAAQTRIGSKAAHVKWEVADVTKWRPSKRYDVWHDRAAFHFLTSLSDQRSYVKQLRRALSWGGHVIMGTFAFDGPEKCSGLPVARHDAQSLLAALGSEFTLIDERRHEHVTPWGTTQHFQFSTFRKN